MKDPGYRTSEYQDVLARVRQWVKARDGGFDIGTPRLDLADTCPGARDPRGRLIPDPYCRQVLRAVHALVADGTLVKTGQGPTARYWTPEAHTAHLAEQVHLARQQAARRVRWRQAKIQLAGLGIADISGSELAIRLDLADWEDLLARLEGR
jgi:hypothetical protein